MEYDVVVKAEETIRALSGEHNEKRMITKSQIRKFLCAVNNLKNKVDIYCLHNPEAKLLNEELTQGVKFLKVNIIYAAKDRLVKDFMKKAELVPIIDDIGNNIEAYNKFCKYVEALVAYHKFHGGND